MPILWDDRVGRRRCTMSGSGAGTDEHRESCTPPSRVSLSHACDTPRSWFGGHDRTASALRRWFTGHPECRLFGRERPASGPNPRESPGTRGDRKAKVRPSCGRFPCKPSRFAARGRSPHTREVAGSNPAAPIPKALADAGGFSFRALVSTRSRMRARDRSPGPSGRATPLSRGRSLASGARRTHNARARGRG
jgi:hypothetical protein